MAKITASGTKNGRPALRSEIIREERKRIEDEDAVNRLRKQGLAVANIETYNALYLESLQASLSAFSGGSSIDGGGGGAAGDGGSGTGDGGAGSGGGTGDGGAGTGDGGVGVGDGSGGVY